MRTIELYRKHKAGEVSREKFLYEVRRDKNLPWVTNVTSFDDAVKILKNKGIISEAEISENYEVHYTNQNVKAAKKFNSKQQAIKFAQDLVNNKAKEVVVFNAGPNFNSTADTNAVVAWSGDGSFMDNKSKNDSDLAAKKMSLEEETDQERDARRKEGDKEMDQTLLDFLKNLNTKSPTDHIAQKIKDQEAEMVKKYGSLNEADANIPTDPSVDRVNPYFLKKGVQMLLDKEKELTNDSYIKALNKAALMLQKNPHVFDEEMFANAKDVAKADAKLGTEEVKKANHKNKANEMKKVKVKSLKESAIEELAAHLKKKDLINEDSHWKHHVGSEVHTADGKGKVIEIVGGTLTVEMEDGKLVDVQINTADHFTQKAQEENVLPAPERKLPNEDKPLDPSYKMNKDGERAISPKGLEFKIGDEAIAVDNDQKIKIGSFKQEQGRIKAGFSDGINYKYIDIDGLEKPAGDDPWAYFKGKPFGEAVKKYIAKHKDDKEKMSKLKEAVKKLKEVKALVVPKSATGPQIDKIAQADPTIKPGQQIDIIRK